MTQVGFCCMVLDRPEHVSPRHKFSAATVAYVSKLPLAFRRTYILDIVWRNCDALDACVHYLACLPLELRMMRITSGFLPLYTHECVRAIYDDPGFQRDLAVRLGRTGARARGAHIRLSLHPGQYCVLNSAREDVRKASLLEFEYHVLLARLLGFHGNTVHPGRGISIKDTFAINVHGGAWHGEDSFESWDWSWARLSPEARALITLENDEMAWGADEILALCQRYDVRMVFDVHHHWVRTGEWMQPDSSFIREVRQTWGGMGPKMHLSLPEPDLIDPSFRDRPVNKRRNFHRPLFDRPEGVPLTKLRAHSTWIWHPGIVSLMHEYRQAGFSVQVETKGKNLAAHNLARALGYYRRVYR